MSEVSLSGSATVAITVAELSDVPAEVDGLSWNVASEVVSPDRLRRSPGTGAWHTTVLLATQDGVPVGTLALRRARTRVIGEVFDPVLVAPRVFGPDRRDPRDYLFVGGPCDLVAGSAVAAYLPVEARRELRRDLVAAAHRQAAESGLIPAALYVRDSEVDAFTLDGTRNATEVARVSVLRTPATDEEFLTALSANQRRTVLKDRRAIDQLGLRAEVVPAAELMASDQAAAVVELIMDVKRRHEVTDHPRLVRLRLTEWANQPTGERVAFLVGAPQPVAVTFGCVTGARLEIYETGMSYAAEHRHEAYVESLVHAPVRHAIANRIGEIDLGLDAEIPKSRRGAVTAPVWAVG